MSATSNLVMQSQRGGGRSTDGAASIIDFSPAVIDHRDELARFRVDGKVAVVSGGTGAIGRRLSLALARSGAQIGVLARNAGQAADVQSEIEAAGSHALLASADVTKQADVDRAVDDIAGKFGRIDIVINAVGGGAGTALYPAEEYPEAEWDRIMDLNLRSDLLVTQAAVRAMVKQGRGGRVLHISSVRGQLGINAGYLAYVAAKGAVNAITRQQAPEWAKHAITVNAIAPTFVSTPQVASMLADESFRRGLVNRIPLGRIAETDDLVGAVLFFCSDASSFCTGQILTLDGGLTATQ